MGNAHTFFQIAQNFAKDKGKPHWRAHVDDHLSWLCKAFWRGDFERSGESKLTLNQTGRLMKFDRQLMLGILPHGEAWVPSGVRGENAPTKARYAAMAELNIDDYERSWSQSTLEKLEISVDDLRAYLTRRGKKWPAFLSRSTPKKTADDDIGQRIAKVIDGGTKAIKAKPHLTVSRIAMILCGKSESQGYGDDAVRKILSGTYPAQILRGIEGLPLDLFERKKYQKTKKPA